jgi:hypothetical protein
MHDRLARLVGSWSGTARVFLDPEKPPLESAWRGVIAPVLGGRFVRFTYESSILGKPLSGELLLGFHVGEGQWEMAWIDTFHMGTAIMLSTGLEGEDHIEARGTYYVPDNPRWRWRTAIDDSQADQLRIRMYNGTPEGQEELGVAVDLARG